MAAAPTEEQLRAQLNTLCSELDRRARTHRRLEKYDDGRCPLPDAVVRARVTKAYRLLMPMAEAPWGSLVIGSSLDRLQVVGIRDTDTAIASEVWGAWQDNQMDSESKLAHHSALLSGRAFALVWGNSDDEPEISLDTSEQMIVQYREGSRRQRVAALRRWTDDDGRPYAILYRPEALYKFRGPKNASGMAGTQWEPYTPPEDDVWPLPNPLNVVPVVELAVNRRLKPGSFGYARGEFEHCTGLIDRVNLLTFLGLVVAFWMGFPLRGVLGAEILRTDDGTPLGTPTAGGKPVPPFDVHADELFQIEGEHARLAKFDAADRKNLSVFAELDQFATITRTPRHYFPLEQGMSNIAADTIRANEGALHAKIGGDYKPSLGEGWEEAMRLCSMVRNPQRRLSSRAELLWSDHEYRSLGERADAATKLKDILPWQALAEKVLNATSDEISRWEKMRSSDALGQLIAAAQAGHGAPAPA